MHSVHTLNTTNGSADAWNKDGNALLRLASSNNLMILSIGSPGNERHGIIQVGHSDTNSYANIVSNLSLNPLGGSVGIGKTSNINYKLDVNGSINGTSYYINGTSFGSIVTHNNAEYVTSIGTSGNTVTWAKGGDALTAITIPFATNTTHINTKSYTPSNSSVGAYKAALKTAMANNGYGFGDCYLLPYYIIEKWDSDNATSGGGGNYLMTKIDGYSGNSYSLYILSCHSNSRIGVTGLQGGSWTSIKWLAFTSDIPTKSSWNYDDRYIKQSDNLFSFNLTGPVNDEDGDSYLDVPYNSEIGIYVGTCLSSFVDGDGINIMHDSSAAGEGTTGTSSATSGSTIAIPYITTDKYGHITARGTHTHTVTGFATSNSTYYTKLNGSNLGNTGGTSLGSFYAPTSAGTSGLYLKSSGSGAPTWANFPTIPSITLNGSASTSPSFYAPTGGGTSGQYLKSNGANSAPTWVNFPGITSHLTVSGTFWGNSWSNGGSITGSIWAGTNTATSEYQVGVQTLLGKIYLYALGGTGSSTYKGLYVINSSGTSKGIIGINNNNDATFFGGLVGNATSATSATSSSYLSTKNDAYNSPSTGSLSYFTSNVSTVLANTNGIANPTNAYYYHLFMVQANSNGYFCDVAWSLNPTPAGTAPDMYFRIKQGSSYSSWVKVLTDANHTTTGGSAITSSQVSSWANGTNYKILFNSSVSNNGTINSVQYNNNFYVNSNGVYYSSDKNLKDNISKYHPYSELMDNPVRHFTWKNESEQLNIGFIAQEVEKWCPEAVGTSENGNKTVNYKTALTALCGIMYDRIQELEREVKRLSLLSTAQKELR